MAVYPASSARSSGPVLNRSGSPSAKFNRHSSSSPTSVPTVDRRKTNSYTSGSQNRFITVTNRSEKPSTGSVPTKRTCMCSPTNHPGSFRCSMHKPGSSKNNVVLDRSRTVSCGGSSGLNMRRSAMKNSLVRIETEGEMVKRALAALIRPSSRQQRRRGEFQPRPSRLSVMSYA